MGGDIPSLQYVPSWGVQTHMYRYCSGCKTGRTVTYFWI